MIRIPDFTDLQHQTVKGAFAAAGITFQRLLIRPVAASLAYGLDQKSAERRVVVYHLGGAKFEVSFLYIDDGVFADRTTFSDTGLDGENFNQLIVEYLGKIYQDRTGVDVTNDHRAMRKLRREVEKAKRTLSFQLATRIEIEAFES
ncbi:molecular chaperone DnaK, partial [Corallococcus sp. AB049A]|uniref:Hsp70 family protein n=1 Tax=Corallococcus sp. AB049A TaxID=2316721 RepID=UPI000ECA7A20